MSTNEIFHICLNGLLTVAAGVMLNLVSEFRLCPVTASPDETQTGRGSQKQNFQAL